jgi:hypothetical protein
VGTTIFFAGVIGGLLNIIVFLSLRTFRENSCGFYFTLMSFINIGNLITGLLSRIIISGFGIDWTLISHFYCKFRWYCLQFCVLTSFTCTCLATIDQYMATNARARWRLWSNIKIAHCLGTIFIIVYLFHGILYIVYFNLIISPTIGKVTCSSENTTFQQYHVYGYLIILAGALPLIITVFFGLLAHNNVQHLAYRTMPLVQRELDKQLTRMVIVQSLLNFAVTLPYTSLTTLPSILTNIKDPVIIASLNFANVMAILLYYMSFAVSVNCLIYTCQIDSFFSFDVCKCRVLSIYLYVHLDDFVNN